MNQSVCDRGKADEAIYNELERNGRISGNLKSKYIGGGYTVLV